MKKRYSISYQSRSEGAERRFALAFASGFAETAFSLADEGLLPEEPTAARAAGLAVEALRLPSDGVNLLWEPSPSRPAAQDVLPSDEAVADDTTWEMLKQLYGSYFSFAVGIGVDRVILSPSLGAGLPPVSQTGLARFRTLAEIAKEHGVRLLIENDKSAPHFEAVVRVVADGYHGVSFSPAKAWRYFGTSAVPPYARETLMRLSLDDGKGDEFGYLPTEGDTDFQPFARSIAPLRFRGTMAVAPNPMLHPYEGMDTFALSSRAYDCLSTLLRMIRREEDGI